MNILTVVISQLLTIRINAFVSRTGNCVPLRSDRSVNFGARTVEFGTAELHKVSVSFHAFKHIANRFSNSSACALQRVIR